MNLFTRVYSKTIRVWNDIVFETPAISYSIKQPKRNIILLYHGIDIAGKNQFNGRHTPLHYFEKQIRFLSKNYTTISLKDFFVRCDSENGLCAITFDDGYLNNLTNALPVLSKYKTPATFFITGINEIGCDILWADYVNIVSKLCVEPVCIDGEMFHNKNGNYFSKDRSINLMDVVKQEKSEYPFKEKIFEAFADKISFKNNSKYYDYWKLLTEEQIKTLAKSKYAHVGSHGYYHNNLGNISLENACAELSHSKKYLENLTQKPVTSIGYPDGSYSDEVSAYAAGIGIIHQTCSERFNKEEDRSNKFLKNRAGIYNFDSAANQLISAINAYV